MRRVAFALAIAACDGQVATGPERDGAPEPQEAGRIADSAVPRDAAPDGVPIWLGDDAAADAAPDAHVPDAFLRCAPAGARSCIEGNPTVVRFCRADGRYVAQFCAPGQQCVEGACSIPGVDCRRGQLTCLGDRAPAQCEPGLGWRELDPCPEDRRCFRGECLTLACAEAAEERAYLACDYWPVDLPTIRYSGPGVSHVDSPLGVILVNPDPVQAVHVWAYGADGEIGALVPIYTMTPPMGDPAVPVDLYRDERLRSEIYAQDRSVLLGAIERIDGHEVPPGGMLRMLLPRSSPSGQDSGVARTAWHIRSDRPMAAYQFSPLCCSYSFSNDASLLLPQSVLGEAYRFLGVPSQGGALGALTVAAMTDQTEVRLRFPPGVASRLQPGPDPRFRVQGGEATLTLDAGEVLTVQSGFGGALPPAAKDLTGTVIEASMPVAVFSSHQCARWPEGTPACDHLEEQLFPRGTWGRSFVMPPSHERGAPGPETEATWWRLLADEVDTTVRLGQPFADLAPLPPGNTGTASCADRLVDAQTLRLAPGEVCEFGTRSPVRADASAPILVMGIMGGQGTTGVESPYGARAGDPSMFLVPPERQFRSDYAFLTPAHYALSFLTIIAEPDTVFTLDGADLVVMGAIPVPGDDHVVFHVVLRRGPHRVAGTRPFGILLYAFDDFVSYAFTGGLDLRKE